MTQKNRDFAAGVVAEEDGMIVVVREISRKSSFWKYPAGHSLPNETPEQCATRELFGETGVRAKVEDLELVRKLDRGDHDFFLFRANSCDMSSLKEFGDDGEQVRLMTAQEILSQSDFMRGHVVMTLPLLAELADLREKVEKWCIDAKK